ncbi:MAG: MBL fold metallo-hydrolase [Polyangiales bacterium]
MQVTVLASGSLGNATLFESAGTRVLVDAGIGPRTLRTLANERLPHAVVITHAHHDHVAHAERLGIRLDIPVFVTPAIARAITLSASVDRRLYSPREAFAMGALTITPTPIPHDAAQVALVISDGRTSAAIVTDLGEIPGSLEQAIVECDLLLIESNHDRSMLERGPYPWQLKQRIASARGHLSNEQTHTLLRRLSKRTHTVVLMHLSQTNNAPELALTTARDALSKRSVRVLVAPPRGSMRIDTRATMHGGADRLPAQQLALAY